MDISIRRGSLYDLDAITQLELDSLADKDIVTREAFAARLDVFPDHFFLMFDGTKLIGFIDGLVTDLSNLTDDMYNDVSLHHENGDWQMIFGLATRPEYRGNGYGGMLMEKFIEAARKEERLGLVLAAREEMISYFERFGFVNEGISQSKMGGSVWYQMRLTF